MKSETLKLFLAFIGVVGLGAVIGWAASEGGAVVGGMPVLLWLIALAYLVQWVVFIPSFIWQTEKFFDLTGSATYILVMTLAVWLSQGVDARAWLTWGAVVVWAVRLGSFLVGRIQRAGKDDRFDALKPSFWRFLNVWTIQGLWVSLTLIAALVTVTNTTRKDLDLWAWAGMALWLFGFAFEVIADEQKRRFSADPANKGKFIYTGLWAHSRHPNYFGEIVLWLGIAMIALPVLHGWQWLALISPVFVAMLLTRVSGIPLLEQKADRKWGGQAEYEEYKKNTPVLIPRW